MAWRSAALPDGKELREPADTIDATNKSLWSTSRGRSGHAIMLNTGNGTHYTVTFVQRMAAGKGPADALNSAYKALEHVEGDPTAIPVAAALTTMWGKNSAHVGEGSALWLLKQAANRSLEADGHIEVVKKARGGHGGPRAPRRSLAAGAGARGDRHDAGSERPKWTDAPVPRGMVRASPSEAVNALDSTLWSVARVRRGGAIMLDTGDRTHFTVSFITALTGSQTLDSARETALAAVSAMPGVDVTACVVRAALTTMWGEKSSLVDSTSTLVAIHTTANAALEAAGYAVDKSHRAKPHIEVMKRGRKP